MALVRIAVDAPDLGRAVEMLDVVEIGANGVGGDSVVFDPEDLPAVLAESDARYLAGEGAAPAAPKAAGCGRLPIGPYPT